MATNTIVAGASAGRIQEELDRLKSQGVDMNTVSVANNPIGGGSTTVPYATYKQTGGQEFGNPTLTTFNKPTPGQAQPTPGQQPGQPVTPAAQQPQGATAQPGATAQATTAPAPVAPAVPQLSTPQGYMVQPGDTVSAIAKKLGVSTDSITGYRSGNPNLIYPGETLSVRGGSVAQQVGDIAAQAQGIAGKINTLSSAEQQGMVQTPQTTVDQAAQYLAAKEKVNSKLANLGITADPAAFDTNPIQAFSKLYQDLFSNLGLSSFKDETQSITDSIETIDNAYADDVSEVNANPWLSEGQRSKKITQLQDKYDMKKAALTDRLQLSQTQYQLGLSQVQFIAGQAMDAYNTDRTLDQNMKIQLMQLAQNQSELDSKAPTVIGTADTGFRQWDSETKTWEQIIAPSSGSSNANKLLTINEAKDLGVPFGTTVGEAIQLGKVPGEPVGGDSDALFAYDLTTQLINDKNLSAASGLPGISSYLPGTATAYTQSRLKELAAVLALENRQKLKGQGTVSDFEGRLLESAASALAINRDTGRSKLSDKDLKRELQKVRAGFAFYADKPVLTRVIPADANSPSKIIEMTREMAEDAIRQGYTLEFDVQQ